MTYLRRGVGVQTCPIPILETLPGIPPDQATVAGSALPVRYPGLPLPTVTSTPPPPYRYLAGRPTPPPLGLMSSDH